MILLTMLYRHLKCLYIYSFCLNRFKGLCCIYLYLYRWVRMECSCMCDTQLIQTTFHSTNTSLDPNIFSFETVWILNRFNYVIVFTTDGLRLAPSRSEDTLNHTQLCRPRPRSPPTVTSSSPTERRPNLR